MHSESDMLTSDLLFEESPDIVFGQRRIVQRGVGQSSTADSFASKSAQQQSKAAINQVAAPIQSSKSVSPILPSNNSASSKNRFTSSANLKKAKTRNIKELKSSRTRPQTSMVEDSVTMRKSAGKINVLQVSKSQERKKKSPKTKKRRSKEKDESIINLELKKLRLASVSSDDESEGRRNEGIYANRSNKNLIEIQDQSQ